MDTSLLMARKNISISDTNHKRLSKLGQYGETMDDIIGRILDYWEKGHNMKPAIA
jgi:hypothetical protein